MSLRNLFAVLSWVSFLLGSGCKTIKENSDIKGSFKNNIPGCGMTFDQVRDCFDKAQILQKGNAFLNPSKTWECRLIPGNVPSSESARFTQAPAGDGLYRLTFTSDLTGKVRQNSGLGILNTNLDLISVFNVEEGIPIEPSDFYTSTKSNRNGELYVSAYRGWSHGGATYIIIEESEFLSAEMPRFRFFEKLIKPISKVSAEEFGNNHVEHYTVCQSN